jgi:hypothetical protein
VAVQAGRNVAIIAVLAVAVALLPGGGTAADALLSALSIAFMAAMGFLGYRMYRENQMTLWTMGDRDRAILYGGIGMIALMAAGADKMLGSGAGTALWLVLIGASGFAIFRTWVEARRYS